MVEEPSLPIEQEIDHTLAQHLPLIGHFPLSLILASLSSLNNHVLAVFQVNLGRAEGRSSISNRVQRTLAFSSFKNRKIIILELLKLVF